MIDVNKAIATTVKTGKLQLGTKNALRSAKIRKSKLIIFASNCPQKIREKIECYCRLSNIPVSIYNGDSADLGAVCGKPFKVSALSVREPGESKILKITEA
jgi:large subunit ribosomal protein L30e